VPNRRASWAMRRTPYSPFVEKDTAPVLWYVLVASLVLRFSGIVRQSVLAGWGRVDPPLTGPVWRSGDAWAFFRRWLASAATCDGRSDRAGAGIPATPNSDQNNRI